MRLLYPSFSGCVVSGPLHSSPSTSLFYLYLFNEMLQVAILPDISYFTSYSMLWCSQTPTCTTQGPSPAWHLLKRRSCSMRKTSDLKNIRAVTSSYATTTLPLRTRMDWHEKKKKKKKNFTAGSIIWRNTNWRKSLKLQNLWIWFFWSDFMALKNAAV